MSDPGIAPVAAAGALLAGGALLWRVRARRRARRSLTGALTDPDPTVRRSALMTVGSHGLGPFVDVLLARARDEQDPDVRRTIADVVLHNQWEPADTPALVDLRLWAHTERGTRPPPDVRAESRTTGSATAPKATSPAGSEPCDAATLVSRLERALGQRVLAFRLDVDGDRVEPGDALP